MGRWLPGTPLFLWPIKVVSWAGIRQKNVPKDTVCALCFKFEFFSSLQKISDIFLGGTFILFILSFFPFFLYNWYLFCCSDFLSSWQHNKTICGREMCSLQKYLGGEEEVQRKWCKPELQIITVCLPLWFAVCSCEIRCGIKISFSRLFLSVLFFPFLFDRGDRIGGPQQVFDPVSQHRLGELSMCGFKSSSCM